MGLGRRKIDRLIDLLRMNFMYQTPRPEFPPQPHGGTVESPLPIAMHLRMKPEAYVEMIGLITEHGGWDLTPEQKRDVYRRHETLARAAAKRGENGLTYDFSGMSYGDLAHMWTELESLGDLSGDLYLSMFKGAVGDALANAQVVGTPS